MTEHIAIRADINPTDLPRLKAIATEHGHTSVAAWISEVLTRIAAVSDHTAKVDYVVELWAAGLTDQQIAAELGITRERVPRRRDGRPAHRPPKKSQT